jgi:hypothetical protein
MVAPAPVNPPGQQIAPPPPPNESAAGLSHSVRPPASFLSTYGFHLLIVLLGIALAFM